MNNKFRNNANEQGEKMQKAISVLKSMGYEILSQAKETANGPDLHVSRDGVILRVEVKTARAMKRSMAVHPVEPARRHDDLICVEFPSGYVLVEPMRDYLSACASSGSRSFFGIY